VSRPVSEELSDCTYLSAVKLKDEAVGRPAPYFEMSSLSEARIARLTRDEEALRRLRSHNGRQLTRIYPAGTRVMSNNMEAEDAAAAWAAGCHMLALNFQTWDTAMQLNAALFSLNGGCGYVLKPKLRPMPPMPLPSERLPAWPPELLEPPTRLRLVVLSAQHLPKRDGERCVREEWDRYHAKAKFEHGSAVSDEALVDGDIVSPSVEVRLYGGLLTSQEAGEQLNKSTAVGERHWRRAETTFQQTSDEVRSDGLLPTWNFDTCALVWQPEVAYLHLGVYKTRRGRLGRASRTLLAYEVVPVWCLRQGYRSVPLRSPSGNYIKDCALLVYVSTKSCSFEADEPMAPPMLGLPPQPGEPPSQQASRRRSSAVVGSAAHTTPGSGSSSCRPAAAPSSAADTPSPSLRFLFPTGCRPAAAATSPAAETLTPKHSPSLPPSRRSMPPCIPAAPASSARPPPPPHNCHGQEPTATGPAPLPSLVGATPARRGAVLQQSDGEDGDSSDTPKPKQLFSI
jgi:hypothetical protein